MATNNSVNTSLAGQTGTGVFVGATSPTLVTPVLGAATATSINFGGGALSSFIPTTVFTPTVTFATPGDLSVAYVARVCSYTKIGNLVFVSIFIQFTPTYTTSAGNFIIADMPVAGTAVECGLSPYNNSVSVTYPAGTTFFAIIPQADTTALVRGMGSATASAIWTVTELPTALTHTIAGSGFYLAAA